MESIFDKPVILRTNHSELDQLLGSANGFRCGLWLIGHLEKISAIQVANELFNKATVTAVDDREPRTIRMFKRNPSLVPNVRVADYSQFIIDPDLGSATELLSNTWSIATRCGEYVPVVMIEDSVLAMEPSDDPDAFRLRTRALREWADANRVLVLMFTKMSVEAMEMQRYRREPWLERVAKAGYFKYDRRLDCEADGVWIVDLPENVPEVIRVCQGKHRTLETPPSRNTAVAIRDDSNQLW